MRVTPRFAITRALLVCAAAFSAQPAAAAEARFVLRADLERQGDETSNARYLLRGHLHRDGPAPAAEGAGGYLLQAWLAPTGTACLPDLIFANGFQQP